VSIRDEWLHQQNGSGPTDPVVLWLGKLRRYKCPHHAVQAMAEVVEKVPMARLVIAGRHDDIGYEKELRTLVDKLGLQEHVAFRFNLTEQEKRKLIGESRVVVMPSSVEGFGIVVLEANACGVPVVASSGVPEGAVQDGVNGLRYQFGDINQLSGAILKLLEDPDLHSRLSSNALKSVEHFRWSRVGPQFEQVVALTAEPHR
jgi:glycosyltransferase involved in cell wall biosynthesis